ncbi:MAG: indole-3-glycerol phosphate synthase TrpC, partial [Terriglobia bacterium]
MKMTGLDGTTLGEIVARRRLEVEQAKTRVPVEELEAAAEARHDVRDFKAALRGADLQIVAEMKKASPSSGVLRSDDDYDCAAIAQQYAHAGAAALSVLTEEGYFLGSLDDIKMARAATALPVLRKDFIVDPYQVYESAARGADALLLIVAALPDHDLRRLLRLAETLRVAALVEVHT